MVAGKRLIHQIFAYHCSR